MSEHHKRVIEFTIRMEMDVPRDPSTPDYEEKCQFYFEENTCMQNLIEKLHMGMKDDVCNECDRGRVRLLEPGAKLTGWQ